MTAVRVLVVNPYSRVTSCPHVVGRSNSSPTFRTSSSVDVLSTPNAADATVCQEYVVQGDDVLFHLRPKDTKHAVLLPVGKEVAYRIEQDRFFLHTSTDGKKEREYLVVSMEPRAQSDSTVQTAMKLNHLQ